MAVPDEYVAVWSRVSIALDDQPAVEYQDVTWIQSGELYCDLRVPLAERLGADVSDVVSFAGDCISEPPCLRWTHQLELDREPGPGSLAGVDVGEVWWDGADLIERGSFEGADGPIVYTEVWRRLDPGDGMLLALASVDGAGRMVVVGDHALVVVDERGADLEAPTGTYRARYQRRSGARWVVHSSLGEVGEWPDPPTADSVDTSGGEIEWNGRRWTVVESRPVPVLAPVVEGPQ